MNEDKAIGCLSVIGIVLVIVACLFCARGCVPDYSDGQRAGELRKFSHKGLIWKSWEGQLLLSNGYVRRPDGSGSPDIWEFSVVDPKVAEQLAALPIDAKVSLTYRQWMIGPVMQDTKYVVTGIQTSK